ncbi:hypothetical protein J1605_009985 [Eschrichtius robustus]|uniref:Uncharacterized protein n=1 Tax=Eschrichtius robustus TaxID=9764 RepID=A0AB34GQG5_ESCRO|nr:hypothetical protein J1605_009985 [Eschrichtius robustus]
MWDSRATRCVAAREVRGAPPAFRAPRLFPEGGGPALGPATPEAAAALALIQVQTPACCAGSGAGGGYGLPGEGGRGARCDRTAAACGLPRPHPGTEAEAPGPTSRLLPGTPGPRMKRPGNAPPGHASGWQAPGRGAGFVGNLGECWPLPGRRRLSDADVEGKEACSGGQPAFPPSPHRMDPTAYAELLKESGNQVFKNGNFSLAIRKYDEAIQILLHLYRWGVSSRDLAVLLCNKSNAFYSLGKWNEAYVAAKECLQWDPTYVKGYYRAGYSLLQLLKPYEAAHMFFKGLRLVQVNQDQTQFADFLVGVFTTMGSKSGLGEARPLSFF